MGNYDAAALKAELTRDEGRRSRIYVDTVGKVSGGIGRNLTDKGFRDNEIDLMYQNDIAETEAWLDRNLPWWRSLDPVRQRVMMNMAFNMQGKLLTFVNTLAAIKRGDYAAAADGMLASKWASQVGDRAKRLADMMRSGA
ncbi:glycoside hydrolase family protein [Burkholderia multivorans]|uniref:Glycoside hydrolase family protein n=1 Tax=Burkholderia multivorans TaxID=87883 RepID=A0AAP2HN93_9BURK|nr:glycoside hydrolase family protein [Burkholderia multivorans]MBH9661991.1 glycoside hydrolase family protein [Burkholderia multivorans]MBU9358915.1 glycoside hydrolase family protein [Burkholderia multivorans]MBU9648293.1 glycoside hydrolase family protein [Burkholderia multivorans]MCL4651635.1 glycoside hydrolase family protein [Burkholderia multivorans]MCL4655142.1 glycoside hydrolase family protein [Burkholderia multivorans]